MLRASTRIGCQVNARVPPSWFRGTEVSLAFTKRLSSSPGHGNAPENFGQGSGPNPFTGQCFVAPMRLDDEESGLKRQVEVGGGAAPR